MIQASDGLISVEHPLDFLGVGRLGQRQHQQNARLLRIECIRDDEVVLVVLGLTIACDDTVTLTPTPGHSPCHCCVNIHSKGKRASVIGDLMHHQIQCREIDWSARPDWDMKQSAASRRKFFASVADTDTLILPIHFPRPTVGHIKPLANAFDYKFKRD